MMFFEEIFLMHFIFIFRKLVINLMVLKDSCILCFMAYPSVTFWNICLFINNSGYLFLVFVV